MITVTDNDITSRLATTLHPADTDRVQVLINDAIEMIETAFQKAGRDLEAELATIAWLPATARRVVREMVAAAIVIGPRAGVTSMTTTAGAVTEQRSYERGATSIVSFAGVTLTDEQRSELGLVAGGPRGTFPPAPRWPERYP